MKNRLANTDQVFHYWANQVQPHGHAASVSFRGKLLFSYAEPIANIINEGVVLLSVRRWSNTTADHIRKAFEAARHYDCYRVHIVNPVSAFDHKLNYDDFLNRLSTTFGKIARARTSLMKAFHSDHFQHILKGYNAYRQHFGLDWDDFTIDGIDLNERMASINNEIEAAREAHARKVALAEQKALDEWRNHVGDHTGWFNTMALRISKCTTMIETSQGAEIPVEHAMRLWPLLCYIRKTGHTWIANERKSAFLGPYKVTSITRDTLVVGCHRIPWEEIEQIAKSLGLSYSDSDMVCQEAK